MARLPGRVGTVSIFLSNKLISLDAVIPIVMEIKKRLPSVKVQFLAVDAANLEHLRRNSFLYESAVAVGPVFTLDLPGPRVGWRKQVSRLRKLWFLAKLAVLGRMRGDVFIHFRQLSVWPYKLLTLANPHRVVLMQATGWPMHENQHILDNLGRPRRITVERHAAAKFLGYDRFWIEQIAPSPGADRAILLPPSRTLPSWVHHIRDRGTAAYKEECARLGIDSKAPIALFILGYFGQFRFLQDGDASARRVREAIAAVRDKAPEAPILLKPHSITDPGRLSELLAEFEGAPVHVTYLHPSILAAHAAMCIAPTFSTAQCDAHFFGARTVEFSAFTAEALEATSGCGSNPDYIADFINGDSERLREVVREAFGAERNPRLPTPVGDAEAERVVDLVLCTPVAAASPDFVRTSRE